VHDGTRANDIAHGLAHFGAVLRASHAPKSVSAAADPQPSKTPASTQREIEYLFADEMDIGGPEKTLFFILRAANGARYAVSASNQT